ncbi:hypothetical protein NCC78_20820 [Micromonospora phytophila]|nr:hypothetical protein [Micromonospora phytophila]MCM0677113.1 hypothetical protein [Micromonospora phytophila]
MAAATLANVEWHADLIARALPADLAPDLLSRMPVGVRRDLSLPGR